MAWRSVHISEPARLTLKQRQLLVSREESEVPIPLEDIACLILDTPQISLTGALLSALAEAGIAVLVPDEKHHPAGIFLPFHTHHAQARIAHLQTGIGLPLKKRLWQRLIVAKISNQASLLAQHERPQSTPLAAMASRVTSGDPDNVEARAAGAYWPALFEEFTRQNEDDPRNALLNYGYAVLRAALARACVAGGLLPAFGLHHASISNAFNLVDDLIEPFRPFVDAMAHERASAPGLLKMGTKQALSLEDRRFMAGILSRTVSIGDEKMAVLPATEAATQSTVRAMEHNSAALLKTPRWPERPGDGS